MGGDHGPSVTLTACRNFLLHHPDAKLILVGLPDKLSAVPAFVRMQAVNAAARTELAR